MSVVLPLQPIPNQTLTALLDGVPYEITLTAAGTVMAVTIVRDNVPILSGLRVAGGVPLIPYRYLESGNFIVLVDAGALPFYTAFGVTQNLLYYTAAELEAIRGGS